MAGAMNLKLKKAPLIMTLGAVEFSPIINIESYVPKLQDQLRRNGFPLAQFKNVRQLLFSSPSVDPKVEVRPIFGFYNERRSRVITINYNTISLALTDYISFSDYIQTLHLAVSILAEFASPALMIGLGFRHLNRIGNAEERKQYLKQAFHGMDADSIPGLNNFRQSYAIRAEVGEDSSLIVHLRGGAGWTIIPDEFSELGLPIELDEDFAKSTYILDIDCRRDLKSPFNRFDNENIITEMDRLHNQVNDVFVSMVTADALTFWEQET